MGKSKALPIARRLTARADIKSADKPLLIEVCSLYHNGGRSACDATNKHFSERLGEAKETISRRVSRLAVAGWLMVDEGKSAGYARTLTPTYKCQACYLPAEDLALLTEESIAIDEAVNSPLLTEYGIAIDQKGDPLLTIYGIAIDHLCDSLLIVIEEAFKEQKEGALKEQQVRNLREGLAEAEEELLAAQKKIAELEAQLQAEREASRTRGAAGGLSSERGGQWQYDPAAIADNLVLPFDTPEFRQAWAGYRQYREEKGYPRLTGGMQEQEALRHLGNLAQGSEEAAIEIIQYSVRGGYKTLCKPDAKRPNNPQQHAFGQPANGAKPTGAAVDIAASLVARRFEQRANGNGPLGQATGTNPSSSATVSTGIGAYP